MVLVVRGSSCFVRWRKLAGFRPAATANSRQLTRGHPVVSLSETTGHRASLGSKRPRCAVGKQGWGGATSP
jgi:hypothetical protein